MFQTDGRSLGPMRGYVM